MTLSVTKTWVSGETLTHTDLNQNFTDVLTKINGQLTNDNLSGSAGISNANLQNDDYEFLVNLEIKPTTAAAAGTSATLPLAVVGLPGTTTDGISYTILSGTVCLTDSGDAAAVSTFSINWGDFTGAANTWLTEKAILPATNLTSVTAQATVAQALAAAAFTNTVLDYTVAAPRFIGLFLTALGANALNAAYSSLVVTLKLKRTSGLRS